MSTVFVRPLSMRRLILFLGLAVGQAQLARREAELHYDPSRHALIRRGEQIGEGERVVVLDLIGRRVCVLEVNTEESQLLALPELSEGLYYAHWLDGQGRLRAVRRFAIVQR